MTNYVQSVVAKGRLYTGGGVAGFRSTKNYIVMDYDISSRIWAALPAYRTQYFAMTAINGQLVLVGGAERNGDASKVLGVWETNRETWTHPYPEMHKKRSGCSAIVYNKWLVVAGGREDKRPLHEANKHPLPSVVEVLDTDTKQWYIGPETPAPWYCMKTAVTGGFGYFMGGTDSTGSPTTNIYQVCIETLISHATKTASSGTNKQTWNVLPGLQLVGSSPLSINESLLVVGGWHENHCAVTDIQLYQPDTERWVKVGELLSPRYYCTCAMIADNEVLALLGEDHPYKLLQNMESVQINTC